MLKLVTLLLTINLVTLCFAQDSNDFLKKDNETAQHYIERIIPDSLVITHTIIETNVWDSSCKSIIAFYTSKSDSDVNNKSAEVYGHLYMKPNDSENYRDIEFGPIEAERGPLEILAVFFANADKDKEKELLVLCKYYTYHYDGTGDFYDTYIYLLIMTA